MGSGKTTVAKKLASALKYKFVDLDEEIVKEAKKTIAEIFEKQGEDSFRKREQTALHNTANLKNVVIATGGGAPCFFDNMEWMNREGVTVYLEAPAGLLYHRLVNEKEKRPLLRKLNEIELMEHIHEHLAQREPFYNQSLVKIRAASLNISLLKEKIKKALAKRESKKST